MKGLLFLTVLVASCVLSAARIGNPIRPQQTPQPVLFDPSSPVIIELIPSLRQTFNPPSKSSVLIPAPPKAHQLPRQNLQKNNLPIQPQADTTKHRNMETGKSDLTATPNQILQSEPTAKPELNKKLIVTEDPESTAIPEGNEQPIGTVEAEVNEKPVVTKESKPTAEPEVNEKPVPKLTAKLETNEQPIETVEAAKPEVNEKPVVTEEPKPTAEPEVNKKPILELRAKLEANKQPIVTEQPEPTVKQEENEKPIVMVEPDPTAKPESKADPEFKAEVKPDVSDVVVEPEVLKLDPAAKPEVSDDPGNQPFIGPVQAESVQYPAPRVSPKQGDTPEEFVRDELVISAGSTRIPNENSGDTVDTEGVAIVYTVASEPSDDLPEDIVEDANITRTRIHDLLSPPFSYPEDRATCPALAPAPTSGPQTATEKPGEGGP